MHPRRSGRAVEETLLCPDAPPSSTVSFIRSFIVDAWFDALEQALAADGPVDAVSDELTAVVDEIYGTLSRYRTMIRLIEASARPPGARRAVVRRYPWRPDGRLTQFEARMASGDLRTLPDARVARAAHAAHLLVRRSAVLRPLPRGHERGGGPAERPRGGAGFLRGRDMTPEVLAMLAGIIAVSYAVQTITGFGSMVVCVTLGANLVSIHELVTLAVPMSLLQTGTIVLKHREDVDWTVLLRRVFPWMGTGLLVALVLLQGLEAAWLKPAFGAMVLVLAARELWRLQAAAEGGPVGAKRWRRTSPWRSGHHPRHLRHGWAALGLCLGSRPREGRLSKHAHAGLAGLQRGADRRLRAGGSVRCGGHDDRAVADPGLWASSPVSGCTTASRSVASSA